MAGIRVALVAGLFISAACGSTAQRTASPELVSGDELSAPSGDDVGADKGVAGDAGNGATGGPVGRAATRSATTSASLRASTARNTAPLKIGVAYVDNSSTTTALGASTSNTVDGRKAAQALVRGINAAGGLHGRRLETVEYSWNAQSNNYDQDATTACERFTKDSRVEVVVDTAFGIAGGFGGCLQKAGVLHLTSGIEGDRTTSQSGKLHANAQGMVNDRTYAAVLTNLAATRYLTASNQLGIIVEQCPSLERAYSRTLVPLIAKLGLKSPIKTTIECTTGFASAGPAASATSSAILAFRQRQVDRVIFVSDYEAVVLLLFANNASAQQYHPGYALSSGAQPAILAPSSNIPADQWPQLHGVGNFPGTDVADSGAAPSAVDGRCLQVARAGGLVIGDSLDKGIVYYACGPLFLLEAGLERTNGNSAPAALMSAISGLGTSFAGPGLVANRTRFSNTQHDGPNAVQVFGYVSSCTCMRYSGQPLPAPD